MKVEQIQKVAVVGAGTMGRGIAQVYAQRGFPVNLTDVEESVLTGVKEKIRSNLKVLTDEGLISEEEIKQTMDRLFIVRDLEQTIRDADFVTEAIIEDLEAKQNIFKEMEKFCSPTTILATNTSGFRISDIASSMERPERTVITHWFNPPHIIPLVEVVRGEATSDDTFNTTYDLLVKAGKTVVRLEREIPGFLVNRMQVAMYREAISLAEMGVASKEDIDLGIKAGMGFRLACFGPLRVMDMGGLDVWYSVFRQLLREIDSTTGVANPLKERVERGELGLKTGKGFYEYTPESIKSLVKERDKQFMRLLKTIYGNLEISV